MPRIEVEKQVVLIDGKYAGGLVCTNEPQYNNCSGRMTLVGFRLYSWVVVYDGKVERGAAEGVLQSEAERQAIEAATRLSK